MSRMLDDQLRGSATSRRNTGDGAACTRELMAKANEAAVAADAKKPT